MQNEDILKLALERFEEAYQFERDNIEAGLSDLAAVNGDQWDAAERESRALAGRPCVTINRLPQFANQIIGDVRQNKPSVKVSPVDDLADKEVAEILSGQIRHIENASDATAIYATAAEEAVNGGIGAFRIVTDYSSEDTFDQDIFIKPIRGALVSVLFDPAAKDLCKRDAGYVFVVNTIPLASFKERWPDANTSGFDGSDLSAYASTRGWYSVDTVRVAEYWVKRPKKRTFLLLSDGRTIEAPEKDLRERFIAALAQEGLSVVRYRDSDCHEVVRYLISGRELLEDAAIWPGKHIPIIPVLGIESHNGNRVTRRSLVRFAIEPQKLYNFWASALNEAVDNAPKAPFIATPDQIIGFEDQWKNANRKNYPYLLANPDSKTGAMPQRQPPPPLPASMTALLQIADADIQATTGIYKSALGAPSNETSGKAINARQRESDVGTFQFIDNLARSIKYCGEQLVDLIPRVYDTERTIRILGDDDSEKLARINRTVIDPATGKQRVINDVTTGKYDVTVSVGPSYSTKRQESVEGMMAALQTNPQLWQIAGDLIVKNFDWPGADQLAERLKKTLPPGMVEQEEEPDPAAQQAMQAKAKEASLIEAKMTAEIEQAQAEAEGKKLANTKTLLEIRSMEQSLATFVQQAVQDALVQYIAQQQQDSGVPPGMPTGGPMPGPLAPEALNEQY